MLLIVLSVLTVIGVGLHLSLDRRPRTRRRGVEIVLLYVFALWVGVPGILGFAGHTLRADKSAEYIGWPAGNPFQTEVAFADLAFGVLGILSIWFRGQFWTATGIGLSIFMLGAAYTHINDIMSKGNVAMGNAGSPLYADLLLPLVILGLLAVRRIEERQV